MGDIYRSRQAELRSLKTPKMWIRPYYGSFNGLRGLAVTLVFFSHFGGSLQRYTGETLWVGVDLFFVLSGFLITGILYDSLESPHYFRNFYIRRTLRIFPIFYGFFLVIAILIPFMHLHMHLGILAFVFYFGNLVVPFADLVARNPTTISILRHGRPIEIVNIGHLWSLCVEEQFYLIWPAVVWLVRSRVKLMCLCGAISILALSLRFFLATHAPQQEIGNYLIHWSTYTRCDTLLIGAWVALFLRHRMLSLVELRRISTLLFGISSSVLVAGTLYWHNGHGMLLNRFLSTIGYTLIALAGAGLLIRSLDEDSKLSRVLRFRPLSGLGVISYGFYFYHALPSYPVHRLAGLYPGLSDVIPLAWFAAIAGVAWLSFHFYETPFLRLKKVFAPQPVRPKGAVVD